MSADLNAANTIEHRAMDSGISWRLWDASQSPRRMKLSEKFRDIQASDFTSKYFTLLEVDLLHY